MRKWLLLVLSLMTLLPAVIAAGDQTEIVTVPPPGKIYLDDIVHVKINRARPAYDTSVRMDSDGFEIHYKDQVFENDYVLYPRRTGYISVGPFHFINSRGIETESTRKLSFEVLPSADQIGVAPEIALARLEELHRVPITVRAESEWIRAYVGRPVTISWIAYYRPVPELFSFGAPQPANIDGLQIVAETVPGLSRQQVDLGRSAIQVEIARWTIVPARQGSWDVRPDWAGGETSDSRGNRWKFRREIPSVRISTEGLPDSVASGTPIGEFSLECPMAVGPTSMGALVASMRVVGDGIIENTLDIDGHTSIPMVVRFGTARQMAVTSSAAQYEAKVILTALSQSRLENQIRYPEITFRYWNPDTRAIETARCEARTLPVDWHVWANSRDEEVRPDEIDADLKAAPLSGSRGWIAEMIALLSILAAAYGLRKALG